MSETETRDRLLSCAAKLFHERSYQSVGVAEICSEAEVTKGSFYHFFPSKDDLVASVIEARWTGMQEFLLDPTLGGPGSARERLERFFDVVLTASKAQKRRSGKLLGCPIGNLAIELSTTDPTLRKRLARIFNGLRDRFAGVLRDAVEAGEVTPRNVEQAALALVALFHGAMVLGKTTNDPSLIGEMKTQALVLAGYEAP